jgi:hypothetical protein
MHASSKVDVYVSITSNPIIEHCQEIRFAPYPKALAPSLVTKKAWTFAIILTRSLVDLSTKQLALFSVQDFSIRATPLLNYVVKSGADTDVCKWPLATVSGEELERALVRIIPYPSDQEG